ncbi:hypothetical protein roselon_00468 [Roseibacterium elongatum DSM 19469]|uniref:Lipoprotein n=1 Tax=Roseicyclus elongatus DSM 19469 TaxID=1294273 RepID=W8SKA2_9RHOB|nr:hypothetical protein [Roseibacterium elongatum]AHM02910.1 hypothetical protein roselon_00468 [Roseibacterium elongatum DSM 19469]
MTLPAAPVLADDCAARLSQLLATSLTAEGPYIAENVNMVAGMRQVFRQHFVSDTHFLVEQLEPAGMPDTLHYDGGAWTADGAGGWTLAWQIPAEEAAAGMVAQRQAMAAAVENARCTTETRDGRMMERISGLLGETPTFGPSLAVAYLVDATSGQVTHLTYDYTLNGMEMQADYVISPAPNLTLPLPPSN